MQKFIIKSNNYLDRDVMAYYNKDYIGYQKIGNPDYLNHLKNMSGNKNEIDLVKDFIEVNKRALKDLEEIIKKENLNNPLICVMPRSKSENHYKQNQLLFKKSISSAVCNLNAQNGENVFKRVKDTKTTHDWRLENNNGDMPYKGITKDTCEIQKSKISEQDIILVDDIYTKDVNAIEDCAQTLFDFNAKNVIIYVLARTKEN